MHPGSGATRTSADCVQALKNLSIRVCPRCDDQRPIPFTDGDSQTPVGAVMIVTNARSAYIIATCLIVLCRVEAPFATHISERGMMPTAGRRRPGSSQRQRECLRAIAYGSWHGGRPAGRFMISVYL